ncbi:chemotaxis protein CheW [Candidatus Endobugula sertula]|uniref:Chemotaxis protein CheW n=1 Tax=Candidatus Endobugula sertula TaxID=62101 RepID=A0A1D2QQW4_9GAMM|nr:chemotaxis protein CheW [Candidatus Endobugula sertula]
MNMQVEVPEVDNSKADLSLGAADFITDGDQYLTFCLDNEHYGVDILAVTEIRGWENPTLIPNSPSFVKGVINSRGVIVPILDLRIRFQIGKASYDPTTVVIVLAVKNGHDSCTMGFVVDAVSDVLNADEDEIKPAPVFDGLVAPKYINGLVNVNDHVVTLLKVEQLLSLDDEVVNDE